GLSVTREYQLPSIGGRKMHVQHLDGGKFLQHGAGSKPGCQRPQSISQRDMQTISQKRHKNVRLDPRLQAVKNWPQAQIIFEVFESRFDLRQLDIKLPQLGRLFVAKISAQQVTAFSAAHLAQLVFKQLESEARRLCLVGGLWQLHG